MFQLVRHERVVLSVHVHIQTVGEKMIVIHAESVVAHEAAELVRRAWRAAHAMLAGFRFGGLGFDDSSSSHRDTDRAILLESPIEEVVVIADDRSRSQDEFPRRASPHDLVFEMAPCRTSSIRFVNTCLAGSQNRDSTLR